MSTVGSSVGSCDTLSLSSTSVTRSGISSSIETASNIVAVASTSLTSVMMVAVTGADLVSSTSFVASVLSVVPTSLTVIVLNSAVHGIGSAFLVCTSCEGPVTNSAGASASIVTRRAVPLDMVFGRLCLVSEVAGED